MSSDKLTVAPAAPASGAPKPVGDPDRVAHLTRDTFPEPIMSTLVESFPWRKMRAALAEEKWRDASTFWGAVDEETSFADLWQTASTWVRDEAELAAFMSNPAVLGLVAAYAAQDVLTCVSPCGCVGYYVTSYFNQSSTACLGASNALLIAHRALVWSACLPASLPLRAFFRSCVPGINLANATKQMVDRQIGKQDGELGARR